MTYIELPYVTIHYDEPVVIFDYKNRTQLGVPELKKIVGISTELSGGKAYVTFSDARKDINMTDQARAYLAVPENMPLCKGAAILVSTTLFSYAVNFALHFSKRTYPVKAFVTEEKAREWLVSIPLV